MKLFEAIYTVKKNISTHFKKYEQKRNRISSKVFSLLMTKQYYEAELNNRSSIATKEKSR